MVATQSKNSFFAFAIVFAQIYSLPSVAQNSQSLLNLREKQALQANAEFFRALSNSDGKILRQRIADDALLTGNDGAERYSKETFLIFEMGRPAVFKVKKWLVKSQRQTVVITGQVEVKHGKDKAVPLEFVNVFVKRKNRWQVLLYYFVAPVTVASDEE